MNSKYKSRNSPNAHDISKLTNEQSKNPTLSILSKEKNRDKMFILKNLIQTEESLKSKINTIKSKQNELNLISYTNLPKAKIDSTIYNFEKKNLENLEKDYIDKLTEVKRQIEDVSKTEQTEKVNNLKKFKSLNNSNNKINILEANDIRLYERQKEYNNKQKELKSYDEKIKNEKKEFIENKRKIEKELIKKRFEEVNHIMEDIKKKTKPLPKQQDCLFFKMEKNFIENEKKFLDQITNIRKVKNACSKQENMKSMNLGYKSMLQKRAEEQTLMMKKLWHSRSMLIKEFETNNIKAIKEENKLIKSLEYEKKIKLTKNELILSRNNFAQKKVKLPPIDEKLRQEMIMKKIDIKKLKGKERVNYVKEKYIHKNLKSKNMNQYSVHCQKFLSFNKKNPKKITNLSKIPINNINNSLSHDNIKERNPIYSKLRRLDQKIKDNLADNPPINEPKQINYLNIFKNSKPKFHKWKDYIINTDKDIDVEGLKNINNKIQNLDEKVHMGNQIIKLNGGYEKNVEIGNKMGNLLIDSIKGKLAIIKELYKDKVE